MTAPTPRPKREPRSLLPMAEGLLAAVSLATVAGMWRLFDEASFFAPLVGHALAAHVITAVCRRRGLSVLLSGVVTAAAAALALTWAHLGETTAFGIPTPATFGAAGDRLEEAWRLFDEVKAPAPVLPGFLIAAGAALWAGAWLADLAAFRLWTSFESLVPSGTVFVFASLFAADRGRTGAAAFWLAAALAFVLVHRTVRQHGSPSWLGSDPRLGTASLLKVGAGLVAVSVLLAWALGPRLPGASDAAIVAVRDLDDGGGGSRQTVSPLVEIRGRLVEQSQAELFTVRTTQRAYWRLTSLDEFDGEVWSSRGSFGDADGRLDDAGDPPPGSVEVTQEVAISGLAAIWLPAAFAPRELDAGDAEVRWEAESSTLIVSTDSPTSDGLVYRILSAVPTDVAPEDLLGTEPPPEEVATVGTRLPGDFPDEVVAEAQRIVSQAGATTPYATALALQAYFRDGSFTYTLDAPPGHSDSAILDFLFASRAGYCEQFAGTYAAMARAVGLPARVAVGFTPGEPDPADPTLYHVRGEHAHAWPEVWIPGAGWTAFEPTPGRGAPNAAYTGVPESQDTAGESTAPSTVPSTVPVPVATTVPGAATTTPTPLTDTTEPDPLTPGGADGDASSILGWIGWALAAAVGAAMLVVLGGAGVAGYRALRRWRRRATATTADARVRAAWADTVEAVGVVGVVPRGYETPLEYARRAAKAVGDTRPTPLAWVVERADYAPDGVGDDEAERAVELADGIRTTVRERTTTRTRVLAAVDPRPPGRRGRSRGPRPTGPRIQISVDQEPG